MSGSPSRGGRAPALGVRVLDRRARERVPSGVLRKLPSVALASLLGCASVDGPSIDFATHDGGAIDGGARALLDASLAADDAGQDEPLALGDASDHPEPGRLAGITALHNAVRTKAGASPELAPLTWSPAIAEVARAYAQTLAARCAPMLAHSSSEQRMGYGENLAAFSDSSRSATRAPGSVAETVAVWESERACYRYGPFQSGVNASCTAECAAYGGCGHYTQMVWRGTRSVGCGIAECKDGQTHRSYWVCHYDPPGNVRDALPY